MLSHQTNLSSCKLPASILPNHSALPCRPCRRSSLLGGWVVVVTSARHHRASRCRQCRRSDSYAFQSVTSDPVWSFHFHLCSSVIGHSRILQPKKSCIQLHLSVQQFLASSIQILTTPPPHVLKSEKSKSKSLTEPFPLARHLPPAYRNETIPEGTKSDFPTGCGSPPSTES